MIIDRLTHFDRYTSLHPLFAIVKEFLDNHNLQELTEGKIILEEDNLTLTVSHTSPKSKEQARLEAHKRYIDIQIPISGTEIIGYMPTDSCEPQDIAYDTAKDIGFYENEADTFLYVRPDMFVIFFPQDAHAPAISDKSIKKIVIKVKVQEQ